MHQAQAKADVLAIIISIACILHCLLLPILIATMPIMTTFFFFEESFHIWMILVVSPISAIALYKGWKQHQKWQISLFGILGITSSSVTACLGHNVLPEWVAHFFLSLGSALITFSHIWNIYLCKHGAHAKNNESFNI